jgi:hypothetical protein
MALFLVLQCEPAARKKPQKINQTNHNPHKEPSAMLTQFVGKTGHYRLPYQLETHATVEKVVHVHNAVGDCAAFFVMDNGDRVSVAGVYFDAGDNVRMASATS